MNNLKPLAAALVILFGSAPLALAQPAGVSRLSLDLDRDGRAETFELTDPGESMVTLTIRRPGKGTIVVREMVWSLEPASLARAPNGSLHLNSSHVGIGRSPHEQTLTIAYRNGAYVVAGITRANWDRLEPDSATRCDINLLTGQGTVNGKRVKRTARVQTVAAWAQNEELPAGCSLP